MSSARFTKIDAGLPSLDTTELVFSVNKPVLLTGFSILGGTCTTSEYQYNVSLMKVRLLYSVHTRDVTCFVRKRMSWRQRKALTQ